MEQQTGTTKEHGARVLMISTDPGLLGTHAGSGDVLERHRKYAERVDSLDIIVLGGTPGKKHTVTPHLAIYAVGRGLFGVREASALGRRICADKHISLLVTQDPHLAGFVGMRLKRRFHVPLLVNMHGDFLNNGHWRSEQWQHRVKEYLQKRIIPRADHLRVVSAGIQDKLVKYGIAPDKISVIHTPINDVAFRDLTDEQKVFLEELRYKYHHKFVVVFCGRLVAAKNLLFTLDVVRKAHAHNQKLQFLMIGDGELRGRLKQYIGEKRMEQYVTLLGPQHQDKLAIYYHLAQVLVLLSTNESFGKTIIEAGMAGTPSLASATTGATDIVTDGITGFIVPVNDLNATADVLNEMMNQPEQTKQLGEWARDRYLESYASERTVERIISLWKRIGTSV